MQQYIDFVVNNPFLFVALAATLAMIVWVEIQSFKNRGNAVSAIEATRLQNDKEAVFLDVREDKEYKRGHVPNARHVPLGQLEKRLHELEKYRNRPVILCCETGMRSQKACGMLKKQGFEQVFNLTGGLGAWQKAQLPISTKSK
jgi:rhodanese-related sulfurtransferase